MIHWLNTIRWKNLLIIWLSIIIIVIPHYNPFIISPYFEFIRWAIICSTIAAIGNILNDWLDVKQDKENKKPNIFIGGKNKQGGIILILLLLLICSGAIMSSRYQQVFSLMAGGSLLMLLLYNFIFKKFAFIGNFIIALLSALVFIGIDFIVLSRLIYFEFGFENKQLELIASFAFITTLVREIVKDAEDRRGDLYAGFHTLARYLNDTRIAILIMVISIAGSLCVYLLMMSRHMYFMNYFSIYASWANLICIGAAILLFIPHPAKYIRATRLVKAGMIGSLLIYLYLSL